MSAGPVHEPRAPTRRFILRWTHLAPALLVIAVLVAWLGVRLSGPRPGVAPTASGGETAPATATFDPAASSPTEGHRAIPRRTVTIYWPAVDAGGVVGRPFEIFATTSVAAQAKQVVEELLRGPSAEAAEVVAPFPPGTALRALFVDSDRTAYVSLSRDVVERSPGGSAWERAAVASLVNSLTRSFAEIDRVQILIEGQEAESLAGHVDLTRPIGFDAGMVVARQGSATVASP